jgi:hypothetical protein
MVDAEMLAERCSANDAAEWQNVLALPQNEKQQLRKLHWQSCIAPA